MNWVITLDGTAYVYTEAVSFEEAARKATAYAEPEGIEITGVELYHYTIPEEYRI